MAVGLGMEVCVDCGVFSASTVLLETAVDMERRLRSHDVKKNNAPSGISRRIAFEKTQLLINVFKMFLYSSGFNPILVLRGHFTVSSGMGLENKTIPERYWMAKALAFNRSMAGDETLVNLFEDNHFNVVCMAAYSMGKRGNRKYIPKLIQKIRLSDNWYVQWYAYKALRTLGWQQKQLK